MFKAGDRVRIIRECSGNMRGEEYTLAPYSGAHGVIAGHCTCGEGYWEFVNPKRSKSKFKVGDNVRCINNNWNDQWFGKIFKIVDIRSNGEYVIQCQGEKEPRGSTATDSDLELVNNEPSDSSENKVGGIMNNIRAFVKNLALSADEKLLRKYGFKNECGEYTAEAREFAIQKACEEQEKAMVEVAKGLAAEEKESK